MTPAECHESVEEATSISIEQSDGSPQMRATLRAQLETAAASQPRTAVVRSRPSVRARLLVAIVVGETCGLVAWSTQMVGRTDWAQIWYAARALMQGTSPYSVVGPGRLFQWQFPLLNPLPAVVVGTPLALVPSGATA